MAFCAGSEPEDEAKRGLSQPNAWLPFLANGLDSEYFFFTHDFNRTLIYLTESVWPVCKVHRDDWLHKSIDEFLTHHSWNQCLIQPDHELEPGKVFRIKIEVWDSERLPVKLDVWRSVVLDRDTPVGMVGMARRHHEAFQHKSVLGELDLLVVSRRMAMLTERELAVVELVVQGELNKAIAKKLGVSMRTVEARRASAMEKLETNRLTDLIRFWILTMESPSKEVDSG
jgi:DNA-binding CsgD family transcriptional regulator